VKPTLRVAWLFAPADTLPVIVAKLDAALWTAIADVRIRKVFAKLSAREIAHPVRLPRPKSGPDQQEGTMSTSTRRAALVGALLTACAMGAPGALAQDFPNRPVTLIVPFAPGGATDIATRGIAPGMSAKLGQPTVVENVSGGGATIGAGRVARAAPDGYTLLLHNIAISAIPSLYPNLPFDLRKDVTPIGLVNNNALIVAGRGSLPANNLAELKAWMKTNPVKFAHVGAGTSGHMVTVLLAQALGVNFDYIPYRGAGPALQDLIAGHVDLFITTPNVLIGPILGGTLKGFGITAKEPIPQLPNVPSLVKEVGPQLEIQFWHCLFAPAGTSAPVIDKLNAALQNALDDPKLMESWGKTATFAYPKNQRTPAAADALFRSEIARWGKVIKENNIQLPQQ
jgi:tripartite-type tricarboxylate transporter receptor subunit TctC